MNLVNEQYKIIVESSPNMIWRAGTDALCNYFNTTWLNFTGRSISEEMGNGWAEGVHPEDFDRCLKIYLDAFAKQKAFEMEYRLKRHDGAWRWINDRGVPFNNDDNEFGGYIGSCMDVTEKVEGATLRKMAQTDGLTGINNRQYFEHLARKELQEAVDNDETLFLVMIDVDKFKIINDVYGHQAGDAVLQKIATSLVSSIGKDDLVGRYGGDEFVVLLRNVSEKYVNETIENCRNAIKNFKITFGNNSIATTASFGIMQREIENDLEKLVFTADKKMYENKSARK